MQYIVTQTNKSNQNCKRTATEFIRPPKLFMRKIGVAIAEFDMIQDGDRILLAVSGGKDSLSLLHVLGHMRSYSPVHFDLGVLTVDPQVDGFDPSPLKQYYADLGLPWYYQQEPIMEQAKTKLRGDSFCAYCARMKRGIMYGTCREHGYNVLALAQHLDDLAESLLLSIFHGGQLRTMKAHYVNDAGDIRVIRPLVYCRERQTIDFAKTANLPVIMDNCPACFKVPTERARIKQLLAQEEAHSQGLFNSIQHALQPLLREGALSAYKLKDAAYDAAGSDSISN